MKKNFLPLLFLAAVCSLSLFSCKKDSDTTNYTGNGSAYYPLQVGKYITYNVDSTIWDDFTLTTTYKHYQMRYSVADSFYDNGGRLSYRIETMIRTADTLPWGPGTVYYATPTPTQLEYVENNLRFIKLVYPLTEGKTWNGNSMILTNDQDLSFYANWTYNAFDVGKAYTQDSVSFGNTVTVLEDDETVNDPEAMPTAYAAKTYSKAVYELNVGPVYRSFIHWEYQPGAPTPYRKGTGVVMRAIDHN
ncbi:hypothetical protein ACTHGU_10100 [Chitinophagaceae bacterium MMS25-I14]